MAKTHLDHLKKRYGWTGDKYRQLMQSIIANNTQNVSNAIARISKEGWQKGLKKITTKSRRFIVPDVSEVLPKKSVFIRKGAERGKLLADNLRDQLTKNLRDAMKETTATGLPKYVYQRGKKAGRINPQIIKSFEEKIGETFKGYTKKDPEIGVPRNIHTIAVTEIRSSVNDVKTQYATKLAQKNPDIEIRKKWIHNTYLSKSRKFIRKGHLDLNRKSVPLNTEFEVMNDQTGVTDKMRHPHDPNAPAEQVIGCHCDVEFFARKKKAAPAEIYKAMLPTVEKALRETMAGAMLEQVLKGKKAEIGAVHTHSDGTKWKKVSDTGDTKQDWVKVKTGEYKKDVLADSGKVVSTIKEKTAVDISKVNAILDFTEGKNFNEYLKKNSYETHNHTATSKIYDMREKTFKAMGVDDNARDALDTLVDGWSGASNGPKALALQYGLQKAIGELTGHPMFKFKSESEHASAKNAYTQVLAQNSSIEDFEKKLHGAMYAQFALTHELLKKRYGEDETSIKLYRAIGEGQKDDMLESLESKQMKNTATLGLRPLSSWTTDFNLFPSENIIQNEIPFNSIFITHYSHNRLAHHFNEEEHVVIGAYVNIDKRNFVRIDGKFEGTPGFKESTKKFGINPELGLLPGQNAPKTPGAKAPKTPKAPSTTAPQTPSQPKAPQTEGQWQGTGEKIAGHGFYNLHGKKSFEEYVSGQGLKGKAKQTADKIKDSAGNIAGSKPSKQFKDFFEKASGHKWDELNAAERKTVILQKLPMAHLMHYYTKGKLYNFQSGSTPTSAPQTKTPKTETAGKSTHVGKPSDVSSDQNSSINSNMHHIKKNDIEVTNKNIGGTTGAYEAKLNDSAPQELKNIFENNPVIVKPGKHANQVKEEYLASKIYNQLAYHGLVKTSVPVSQLVNHKDDNKPVIMAQKVGGVELGKLSGEDLRAAKETIKNDFAVDALLGHWDAVGMDKDNMLYEKETGAVYRIDSGGALRYRAQGSPKGSLFGEDVGEIYSMRSKDANPAAHSVYGDLSNEEVAGQIKALHAKFPEIKKVVEAYHGNDKTLAELLEKRMNKMKAWADEHA